MWRVANGLDNTGLNEKKYTNNKTKKVEIILTNKI